MQFFWAACSSCGEAKCYRLGYSVQRGLGRPDCRRKSSPDSLRGRGVVRSTRSRFEGGSDLAQAEAVDHHQNFENRREASLRPRRAKRTRPAAAAVRPVRSQRGNVGSYRVHYQFERFTLAVFSPQRLDDAALERCQQGEGEWKSISNHPLGGRVARRRGLGRPYRTRAPRYFRI
jgi:hypothetical protein